MVVRFRLSPTALTPISSPFFTMAASSSSSTKAGGIGGNCTWRFLNSLSSAVLVTGIAEIMRAIKELLGRKPWANEKPGTVTIVADYSAPLQICNSLLQKSMRKNRSSG